MSVEIDRRVHDSAQLGEEVAMLPPTGTDPQDTGEGLAAKLESVMRDPELNLALGTYVIQLIVPGMVEQRQLTEVQADRVYQATEQTLKQTAETVLTAEQQLLVDRAVEQFGMRNKPSPFDR